MTQVNSMMDYSKKESLGRSKQRRQPQDQNYLQVQEPSRESVKTHPKTTIYCVKNLYTPTIKKSKERAWVRSPINLSIKSGDMKQVYNQYESMSQSLENVIRHQGSKPDREGVFFQLRNNNIGLSSQFAAANTSIKPLKLKTERF